MNAGVNRGKRLTSKKLMTYHIIYAYAYFYRFSALFLDPLTPLTESI